MRVTLRGGQPRWPGMAWCLGPHARRALTALAHPCLNRARQVGHRDHLGLVPAGNFIGTGAPPQRTSAHYSRMQCLGEPTLSCTHAAASPHLCLHSKLIRRDHAPAVGSHRARVHPIGMAVEGNDDTTGVEVTDPERAVIGS